MRSRIGKSLLLTSPLYVDSCLVVACLSADGFYAKLEQINSLDHSLACIVFRVRLIFEKFNLIQEFGSDVEFEPIEHVFTEHKL